MQEVSTRAVRGPFTREELIGLRERCEDLAMVEGLNPRWARAYLAVADAADRLDAMIQRTAVGDQGPGDIGRWT